jgi:putative Ig domain-containing protein
LLELTGAIRGPALTVTNPTLKTGVIKRAYSATIAVTGGKKPYTFTAVSALPPGLRLTRSTGVISGKPAKAGSYTVMVTIADSARPARNTVIVPIKLTIT